MAVLVIRNGFHGTESRVCVGLCRLPPRTVRRIKEQLCAVSDCKCLDLDSGRVLAEIDGRRVRIEEEFDGGWRLEW